MGWLGERERGRGVRVQRRVKLSCGHMDIDRIIIRDDYPNQGYIYIYIWGGGGMG